MGIVRIMNGKMNAQIQKLDKYLKDNVSPSRYEHSLNVAEYARYLALLYAKGKKTARLAFLAGLAHDICKELPDSEQLRIFEKSKEQITEVEKQRLNLLHGATAAYFLKKNFDLRNKEVLQAIKYHTFGSPKLRSVGKLLFIADKIEPGRKEAEFLRALVGKIRFNDLMFRVARYCNERNEKKGLIISPLSRNMEQALKAKLKI